MNQQEQPTEDLDGNEEPFDYSHVNTVARIALYDDLLSAPHVTEIQPAPTGEFIESLATNVYQQSQQAGGTIPYTVIREVSENFIHARFQEATVSILDHGCTIRFADQGPGIACKDRAQLPGFTSAIEPMKSYIRGVGSGLPIVKEYLDFTHGTISIEDNLGSGSVVTISANGSKPKLPKELDPSREDREGSDPEQREESPKPRYRISDADEQPTASYVGATAAPTQAGGFANATQIPQQQPQPQYGQQPMQYGANAAYAQPQTYAPQQSYLPQQGYAMPQNAYGQTVGQQPMPYQQPSTQAYQQGQAAPMAFPTGPSIAALTQREKDFLNVFFHEGALRVADLVNLTGVAQSSVYASLNKLEELGLLEKTADKRRSLTSLGMNIAQQL